jgi:hypothetical protein
LWGAWIYSMQTLPHRAQSLVPCVLPFQYSYCLFIYLFILFYCTGWISMTVFTTVMLSSFHLYGNILPVLPLCELSSSIWDLLFHTLRNELFILSLKCLSQTVSFLFYFIFYYYSFIHMCICCLDHFFLLPLPPPLPPLLPPSLPGRPVLHFSPVPLKSRNKQ